MSDLPALSNTSPEGKTTQASLSDKGDFPSESYPSWRPIDTAPKDGTTVFAAGMNNAGRWFMADVKWDEDHWRLFDPRENEHSVETVVSHWMPLPEPPR